MGRVRHIEVNQLWLQDRAGKKDIKIVKIRGDQNPADHLTKYLNSEGIAKHLRMTGQRIEEGRHELMPNVTI